MCPSQLFSSFFVPLLLALFFFFFFIKSSRADNNTFFANCPSSVCNGRVNISYPFWRLDSHNPSSSQYCGYPGFGILCSETEPILYISEDTFHVKDINYSSYSLTLVDIDALDSSGCPRAHHNLTLEDLPLEYSELDMNLNFYYNCTRSLPDSARLLDCLTSGGTKSYFYNEEDEPEDLNWHPICEKKVVVPVTKGGWDGGFDAAMHEGFVLDWRIATECGKCEASHGRCDYDNLTRVPLCFCNDGTVKFDNY